MTCFYIPPGSERFIRSVALKIEGVPHSIFSVCGTLCAIQPPPCGPDAACRRVRYRSTVPRRFHVNRPEPLEQTMKVDSGAYYIGTDPKAPQVGDVRISFAAVPPGSVSVVSKQVGNTFEAYRAEAGRDIEMLKRGVHTAESMFQAALAANTMLTWILRGAGLFLMFLGLVMVFRPLSVIGDVIPMIGSMLAFGTGLFALVISLALSIGTIGVAWVIYRPVLGIILLSVAIAVLLTLVIRGKKKVASNAATAATATA